MKVAIVHDWLTGMRGGERCLLAFLQMYPNADIFTLVHIPGTTDPVIDARVKRVSPLNRMPGIKRLYRAYLPFYPAAVRSFDLSEYDLIISLSHAAAKNVRVPPGVPHICYCFTPMRYVWDQVRSYFGAATPALWPILMRLRSWDREGARSVRRFVAISRFISARIRCFYGASSSVIYPPVDTNWVKESTHAEDELGLKPFLYAGALVPYKRPDIAVRVCTELSLPLVVVGSGPERERLERMAGPTVTFAGWVSDSELAAHFHRSRALLFPGPEDFGMIPVECMAAGTPVIACARGGARETIRGVFPSDRTSLELKGVTGVFFRGIGGQAESGLRESILFFLSREREFDSEACKKQADLFSPQRFYAEWAKLLADLRLPVPPLVVRPAARGGTLIRDEAVVGNSV